MEKNRTREREQEMTLPYHMATKSTQPINHEKIMVDVTGAFFVKILRAS